MPAEDGAKSRGRAAGIEAARDAFYKGPIAERIARFIADNPVMDASGREHAGLLTYDDIAGWRATVEETASYDYKGLVVHKCPPWTQGPTFLQQLAILDGINLQGMGHNSAEYLHTWIESASWPSPTARRTTATRCSTTRRWTPCCRGTTTTAGGA